MRKLSIILLAILLTFLMVQAQEHDFEYASNHIYLNTMVNGSSAQLVFDTGSSDVYLDSTWLAGCGVNYQQKGKAMVRGAGNEMRSSLLIFTGVNIQMGGEQYSPQMVPVIDLRAILGDKADGIYGMKDWKDKVIAIDYQKGYLNVSDRLSPKQKEGYTRVPIETSQDHPGQILVPIEVCIAPEKVVTGKALLDTGSGQGLTFTSKAASRFGLDRIPSKEPFYYKHGGVGGESAGYEFSVDGVKLGSVPATFAKARYSTDKSGAMASDSYIAVIGNELLSEFFIILDLRGSAIYLKKNE